MMQTSAVQYAAGNLVDNVINATDEQLSVIGEVRGYAYKMPRHVFSTFVCEEYGELTVELYGRIKDSKKVCIPGAEAGN